MIPSDLYLVYAGVHLIARKHRLQRGPVATRVEFAKFCTCAEIAQVSREAMELGAHYRCLCRHW